MSISSVLDGKSQHKTGAQSPAEATRKLSFTRLLLAYSGCFCLGALLGLSAPGFGQWYLAWIGLAPLILLIVTSKSVMQATARGVAFGYGYHLVYMNWYFALHPLGWLGLGEASSVLVALVCYLFETGHQTLLVAIFAGIARALPLKSGIVPAVQQGKLKLPALLVLPLLWVLCTNKIGNAPEVSGVPWAMLEYTQYLQLPLIQITSLIGGVGLEFLMVLANVAVACTIVHHSSIRPKALNMGSKPQSWGELVAISLLVACIYLTGACSSNAKQFHPQHRISCLQIDAPKGRKRDPDLKIAELKQAASLFAACRSGLCLWPAMPVNLHEHKRFAEWLSTFASQKSMNLIVGAYSTGPRGGRAHSIYTFDSAGVMGKDVYKKRYLVPVSEYYPLFFSGLPKFLTAPFSRMLSGKVFDPGHDPTVLSFTQGKVAPLICFEVVSPDMAAASVANGGELLVDIADRSWFQGPSGWMMGEQMLSMAVLRAVENGRYFAFTENTGPSAIIDPTGKIVSRAPFFKSTILEGQVQFISEPTVFNSIFSRVFCSKVKN